MTAADTRNAVLWRIEVSPLRADLDAHGAAVLRDIHELGLPHVERIASSRLYLLEGDLQPAVIEDIARRLLADPITERAVVQRGGDDRSLPGQGFTSALEVHLKGGVMDPVADSTKAAIADMGIDAAGVGLSTARLYRLKGLRATQELQFIARRLLSNDCIEDVYLTGFGEHQPRPEHLPVAPNRPFELRHVPLRQLDEAALAKLSRDAHLFLSLDEMLAIQTHYREQRRDPTDLELETLAQTWSEHCVHKTLKSAVRYHGEPMPSSAVETQNPGIADAVEISYGNLLKETIARATHELIDSGKVDWCLSVFEDNAGIITFDRDYGIAFKAETHNHPSAIEPYGGAATGIGGCIRDVMGCGLGAKPIANTDVFCVGNPDFPMELLPKGVLHPRRILKGIVAGVRDYGNRMGIPTVNGAIVFDDRYLGNPLVFCGCVGLIPQDRIRKQPQSGDLVVLLGGRTGRDGIHGATFSSAELTDTHADEFSHAVQIGNAITEKQVLDAMIRARDYAGGCLYTATTDCGAGGLSSAVGEMGQTLGATVELDRVPLKYAGLRYDEIWISEAQERMVLSVPPKNWEELKAICDAENVEATIIGTFRKDGRLVIRYGGETVGDLDAHFLHNGIPRMQREARWLRQSGRGGEGERGRQDAASGGSAEHALRSVLSRLNTASKEWVIRQYDHEVQGASVVKPLVGPGQGPSDGAVIRPRLDSMRGIALANGICPSLSDVDPYWMAVAAIDEAIRNIVCVGGHPKRTAILDNFCWGNCEDPQVMGALVRACQGCYDAAIAYETPFISGKDSLNNEFAIDPADAARLAGRIPLHNNRIRIPGTLLVSAVSVIEDTRRCLTMDAKRTAPEDSRFFFVGLAAKRWQDVRLADAADLHHTVWLLIESGSLLAAHDCGEEGIVPALAEMAFAGQCGMDVKLEAGVEGFAPVPCGYIVQARGSSLAALEKMHDRAPGYVIHEIGRLRPGSMFRWESPGEQVEIDVAELAEAWRAPLRW